MRNVTFARDHHKSRSSILEDAQRQRQRREEEARRTRAAQRLQRVIRQWLAGLRVVRVALESIRTLPTDVAHLLAEMAAGQQTMASSPDTAAAATAATEKEEILTARVHRACWALSYAVAHPSRVSLYSEMPRGDVLANEEDGVASAAAAAATPPQTTPPSFASLAAVRAYQHDVLQRHGGLVCATLQSCAAWQLSTGAEAGKTATSALWHRLLSSLNTKDVSAALYVLLQQLPLTAESADGAAATSQRLLIDSVVDAIVRHNAAFRSRLDEESDDDGGAAERCSLMPSSPAFVDRWPAAQALTMAMQLATQEPALSRVSMRTAYATALQSLLAALPAPPLLPPLPLSASAITASSSSPSSFYSELARVCWVCVCAPFSSDEYLLLSANPLVVLLNAEEAATAAAATTGTNDDAGAMRGADTVSALLLLECCSRTALDTRLTAGEGVNGVRGGVLRARVLGRLVRLLPRVQALVQSPAPFAADVVKRYLLSVSCLSERLCREPFFIESILADHYAYNTGQQHASLASVAASRPAATERPPRSQYRLLSSYLFSAEGGLRLMQLLTADDEAKEQLRLQALQKPTVEAPAEAAAPLPDAAAEEKTAAAAAAAATSASPQVAPAVASSAAAVTWPTSTSVLQSPLEILCNVFAWPLFTFSKPDYAVYQQETLALCAKLVRTPQLLRRLWSLYWHSCEGLRAVLPPGPVLQQLCARPVWGEEERATALTQEKARGRRVPAAAATAPLLATLPRLPTWETHPRYPMSFYDPHPSLSIFFFTLLAHYVNVCDFAEELRRGGDAAVFTVEEVCALTLGLKEIVHRAHLYGVVPDSNGEAVAHAACLLLARLHIVNEADPFVPSGAEGLWMSVGMVAAEGAVTSIVSSWDVASANVVDEERASLEEDATPAKAGGAGSGAADAVVLSRMPGDDLMFHGSRSWDTKQRYIRLLVHTPFLLPFPARALLLSALLASQDERWTPPSDRPAVVHRGRIFSDAYDLFHDNPMSSNVYNIRFVSEDGTMEAGYGRGVYRECIVSLCTEGFAAEYGLFRQSADGYVFPNSFSAIATNDPQHLQKIRFLGAMVGRALRDGVLQDVPFAQHFRNTILGRRNTLNNLKSFDAELYHQLMSLTQLSEEELQAVGMTFVYTVNALGVTQEVELVRGGAQMEVTPRNCLYYVHLVADFKLNREAADQTRAFCAGLHAVLDSNRLRLFDSNEVGKLFGGDENGAIDLQDWKENTVYDSPDDVKKPQVRLFWDVVESLTRKQQSQLLKFATSMTRPPLLGFSFLSPPFKVQLLTATVSGEDHLPSAATCFSTLKLPPYRDYATARAKIIAAIEETGTFEFS